MNARNVAIGLFMETVEINTASGQEKNMAEFIVKKIRRIGLPLGNVTYDQAHHNFGGNCGNLFIDIPATPGYEHLPCLGFNAHMDRVKPGTGIKPKLTDDGLRIVSDGTTILGADDGAGIAVILQMLWSIKTHDLPHGPIQLIFTVSEETRLHGARFIDPSLIKAEMIFSFDGDSPQQIISSTCASDKYDVKITGKNAHAGVHPDQGISAPLIMSLALTRLKKMGLYGRISGTGNDKHIASVNFNVSGFQELGTNSVQAEVELIGEARAFNEDYLMELAGEIETAFQEAAKSVSTGSGENGKVNFNVDHAYHCLDVHPDSYILQRAIEAIDLAGLVPEVSPPIMGGIDACWLNQHAPTIVFGMGAHKYHQTDEYLDIEEYLKACAIAVWIIKPR